MVPVIELLPFRREDLESSEAAWYGALRAVAAGVYHPPTAAKDGRETGRGAWGVGRGAWGERREARAVSRRGQTAGKSTPHGPRVARPGARRGYDLWSDAY